MLQGSAGMSLDYVKSHFEAITLAKCVPLYCFEGFLFSVGCILSCFGFSFVLLLASDVFGWLRDKSLAIMAVMELEEINAEMSSICPTMNIADEK